MDSQKATNAATRLHRVLTAAQALSNGSTYPQLMKAFELAEGTESIALLRTLVLANESLDEIEKLVKKIPGVNHALFLKGIGNLRRGFTAAATNADFNQWKGTYARPEQIQPLEYCADLLSHYFPEDEIPADELKKILQHVDDVYESVMASGLDVELKTVILESLQMIRQSVHDYRMKGVYGLKVALASATGELVLHKDLVAAAANSEHKAEVDGVFHLLEFLDKITAIATRGKELFKPLLPYTPILLTKGVEIADKLKHM